MGYILPPQIKGVLQYDSISYGRLKRGSIRNLVVDTKVLHNESTKTSATVEMSLFSERQSSYSWTVSEQLSFGESFEVANSVSMGLDIKGITAGTAVSVSHTVSWEITTGTSSTWSNSKNERFKHAFSMTVPPGGWSKAIANLDWAQDAEADFDLVVRATATTSSGRTLSGKQLAGYYLGLADSTVIIDTFDTYTLFTLKGMFTGSFAADSTYDVVDLHEPPEDQSNVKVVNGDVS